MGKIINIFDRKKKEQQVPEKREGTSPDSDFENIGETARGLLMLFASLAKASDETVKLLAENVELIGKIKSSCTVSSNQRGKALKTITEWTDEQIIAQLIKADKRLIQTKPVLFIVALEKLLDKFSQL